MASTDFRNVLAKLIFNNLALPNVGDFAGLQPSATQGSFYIALHTADPGLGGKQNTFEVSVTTWPNYVRRGVPRTTSHWAIVGNNASNTQEIRFPEMQNGLPTTVTHFSVGLEVSGASMVIGVGFFDPWKVITTGMTLLFLAGDLDIQVL